MFSLDYFPRNEKEFEIFASYELPQNRILPVIRDVKQKENWQIIASESNVCTGGTTNESQIKSLT